MSHYSHPRWNMTQSPTQPLRQTSIASNSSSAYSNYSINSNAYAPSRTSTVTSTSSSAYSQQRKTSGHKRGISEAETPSVTSRGGGSMENSPDHFYRNVRQSLRPLPQAPTSSPPTIKRKTPSHLRTQTLDRYPQHQSEDPFVEAPPAPSSPLQLVQRADSSPQPSTFVAPDLQDLKKSSTGHLRTLSKFAQSNEREDYSMARPTASVVGLQNRRQLKRTDSARPATRAFGFERNWMDKQRQFLQAYEYLCHIGEAKEWIEDIIHQSIPPIVELEEALRNGVTLAEIVQAFHPDQKLRVFRNPKLQFKHSDNIVLFFRFLEEVGLPELFRFELIDLYEKKNIPKVIYCIHALSWLLYRKGMVDFRIGNLVGQLQFEHHELEKTQKGLDNAGVSMPSFQGMGASFGAEPEPEPEPVETEEERINRELAENEPVIADFQSQIRGAVARIRLGRLMQTLWNAEDQLIELQSRIRGDWARQIVTYKMDMKLFSTSLQAAARGYLMRKQQQNQQQFWKTSEKDVLKLQSLFRARKARIGTKSIRQEVRKHDVGIKTLQAAIRGALARAQAADQIDATRESEREVKYLQAAIRGMISRKQIETDKSTLQRYQGKVTKLQSAARGLLVRAKQVQTKQSLQKAASRWTILQSVARANVVRHDIRSTKRDLRRHAPAITSIQSFIRAANLREDYNAIHLALRQQAPIILQSQSAIRGFMTRYKLAEEHNKLLRHEKSIVALQSIARGALLRRDVGITLSELDDTEYEVVHLQANIRAMLCRLQVGNLLSDLDEHEDEIMLLQAAIRGNLVRARFAEKKRFFKENMEKVVKIQSVIRAKIQGKAYKSLTEGKNPPVGTLKGFVHLLNDSDFDFNEEIEFEQLRKTVVQHVRQNELADQYIQQLDIKIALLVKNKITLDEVVKHQRHFGGLFKPEFAARDPFDLKALNKTSRSKLEHYQELFFLLQTQPQYLSKLFKCIRERGTSEKECERTKHLIMGLFGYAQKRREEYYLLKLIVRSNKEEVDNAVSLQDYLRTNSFCNKLFSAYTKSPKDRKFHRDVLGSLMKEYFIDNRSIDLESDPMQIYLSAINNEELRTGQRSRRDPNVPREEAIRDPETRATFIAHMQDLRDIADQFFMSLEESLHRMPFGVRFVAQQMYQGMQERFPGEDPAYVLQLVGHWLWKAYLQPALLEPEKFGVADRAMTQEQKRNLGEVAKVLNQAASGREFGGDNIYLQPLNNYIKESIQRFKAVSRHLISIPSAEEHYDIDEFNDLYARTKPTLYIKMADIFSIHQLLTSELDSICPSRDDVLRDSLRELGSVKSNEMELMNVSAGEISLTLTPKYLGARDPDADIKTLLTETKRCVLYIIRIQAGSNLLEILVKPIGQEEEQKWASLVDDELQSGNGRGAYADATNVLDISTLSYHDLKRIALENVLQLESIGRLTRTNNYQDVLNAIAVDIRNKHRRRLQRQRELENVKTTLARLNEQAKYLEQQLKTYNDYIEQAMVTLQNKKGKKRFLLPFTKQWDHERELQRSGRSFKFGSYKYSARTLADKGVLVHWRGYQEHHWHRVDLTISSNEVGVFTIDGSSGNMMIPGASAQVPLDDLLQAQFNNTQYLEFFEGRALRVNVNLFLHLIMKKFYNE